MSAEKTVGIMEIHNVKNIRAQSLGQQGILGSTGPPIIIIDRTQNQWQVSEMQKLEAMAIVDEQVRCFVQEHL